MEKQNQEVGLWFVYILECGDGSYYTGCCKDIGRRLRQHNGEIAGGAKYTSSRQPCRLLYLSGSMNKSEAHKLEDQVKKRRRSEKLAFLKKY